MSVSDELISQFVKAVNSTGDETADVTIYGTVVEDGSELYVKLDGSDVLTPIAAQQSTTEIFPGERVIVAIRNHTATVTGNLSNPAIGTFQSGNLKTMIEQNAEQISLTAERLEEAKAEIKVNADAITAVVERVGEAEASITATADEILSQVKDLDAELESKITQTAEEINQTISNNQGEFTTFKQTVEGWEFVDENGSIIIEDGSIKWDYLSDDAQDKVENAQSTANVAQIVANSASTTANDAYNMASSANSVVGAWVYPGTTKINGTEIMTGTVYASYLKGGTIGIMNANELTTATMTPGLTTGAGLDITSLGTLYLASNGGSGSYAARLTLSNAEIITNCTYLRPPGNATALGSATCPWTAVYSSTSTIQTSDENYKHDIEDLPDKYVVMLDMVMSKRFKMNNGSSDRYHPGFVAQDIKRAMDENDIDSSEFGGWVKDVDEDGNEIQMLRYVEFIPILHAKNHLQDTEIAALKAEVADLKALVNALIESKE